MKQDDAFNQESLLNQEEREILETFEADEFTSLNANELSRHQTYAKNTLKKDKRISIRVSGRDLEGIQRKAAYEGIPYQTLIGSILHKYVNGYLKEL